MSETPRGLPAESTDSHYARDERVADDYFAGMGRDGVEELQRAAMLLQGVPLLQDVIDAIPLPVALLNEKGQSVLLNRRWIQSLGEDADCALGKRHGELLGCIHAKEGSDGCGTSHNCEQCGALVSIMGTRQNNGQATSAYRLRRDTLAGVEAVELFVTSTPIEVDGRKFTIFVVQEADPQGLDGYASLAAGE